MSPHGVKYTTNSNCNNFVRIIVLYVYDHTALWGVGGGGYAARLFLLFSFPCSADHERDWPPCKVVLTSTGDNPGRVSYKPAGW